MAKISKKMPNKPRLVVFDLDETLWPFGFDIHITLPFTVTKAGIVDAVGYKVTHYPEVPQVLEYLKSKGIAIAAASRTPQVKGAKQLVRLFGWDKYFLQEEIYPGCKLEHFEMFARMTGIPYTSMIFFDDEKRNLADLVKVGVHCVHVENGVNMDLVRNAVEYFGDNVIQDVPLTDEEICCEHGEF